MNINVIKSIVEKYSIEDLKKAEDCLLNEQTLDIEIEGTDEGEQLTHILAAIYIKQIMLEENVNVMQAVRLYTQRVRNSIS